jgi:uncharacterized protein YrrD
VRTLKKLQALSVASVAEGALLGRIDDLQFDLASGRVFGFRLKQGVFGKIGGAPAEALTLLGEDLVFVGLSSAVVWNGTPRVAVPGRAWGTEYRGLKVMTRRGVALGQVEDIVVALGPARVPALVLDGGRAVFFDLDAISLGRDSVVLAEADLVVPRPPEW